MSADQREGIAYRIGNDLDLDSVIELYRASTLGERRPIDDRDRMHTMVSRADIVVTAWDGPLMVGIARSISDFAYFTYLADLAVRVSHQRGGIGRELIRQRREKPADLKQTCSFSPHRQPWITTRDSVSCRTRVLGYCGQVTICINTLKNDHSMPAAKQYWLVKQEPTAYAWDQFVKDGKTAWTGVRNFQARNNLQAMREGDLVLFYHSVVGKEVVGIAKVVRTAYPDPTADEPAWICVDLAPVKPLQQPVTLQQVKDEPALKEIRLLRNSRLSVIDLKPDEYAAILRLAG